MVFQSIRIVFWTCVTALFFVSCTASAEEYVDKDTIRHAMHACREGYFMTGADAGRNLLLCAKFATGGSDEEIDSSTMFHNMHACPVGKAMTGWNKKPNLFLCQGLSGYDGRAVYQYGDKKNVREAIPACPEGLVLVGMHSGRNKLLCAYEL